MSLEMSPEVSPEMGEAGQGAGNRWRGREDRETDETRRPEMGEAAWGGYWV